MKLNSPLYESNQWSSLKKIKSIPQYQRADAGWGRSKTYELIASGDPQTVRVMGR
jgi:hypothetical protein